MIKISVVITIYNSENYLSECLNSIINQSLKEIEIICINDASDDKTPIILEEFKKKDNRIKVFTNIDNVGAGTSRNKGLSLAQGKYIIFLDSDDYFEHTMLEEAWKRVDKDAIDICVFKEDSFWDESKGKRKFGKYQYAQIAMEKLETKKYFSPIDIKDVIFNLWNGWAWDKLFRTEFVKARRLQFQEIRTTNDAFFVHSALISAEKITFLNNIFVHHRIDASFSLSNRRDYSWECCYLYLRELKRYLVSERKFKIYEKSFANWAANFLYWNYWTLGKRSRKEFFCALREYMLNEFSLTEYDENIFYNKFDYWFIQQLYMNRNYEECIIPVDEIERWKMVLQINDLKVEKIFRYINAHHFNVAVWGIGKRGAIFLDKYGNQKAIKKLYDEDLEKNGVIMKDGKEIVTFSEMTGNGIDFIIVMGTLYFNNVVKKVKIISPKVKILDLQLYLEPYLSFPLSLEACIL